MTECDSKSNASDSGEPAQDLFPNLDKKARMREPAVSIGSVSVGKPRARRTGERFK